MNDPAMTDPAQTVTVVGGLTQPWATLIAGTAVLVSAIIAALVAWYSRAQSEKHFERKHQLEVNQGLRDRYTAGAEQLGHDSAAIRLAGVSALAALADDWYTQQNEEERQVCIDLLRAYLRTPQPDLPDSATQLIVGEREVRRTVVEAITRRRSRDARDPRSWASCECSLSSTDLNGVVLTGMDLSGMDFTRSKLRSSNLSECDLSGARFDYADMFGADLSAAEATGALFDETILEQVDLNGSTLAGASFTHTTLVHAQMSAANLAGSLISACNLKSAWINHSALAGAQIIDSDLSDTRMMGVGFVGGLIQRCKTGGLDLRGARLAGTRFDDISLTEVILAGANYDDETVWPKDFVPPSSEAVVPERCGH